MAGWTDSQRQAFQYIQDAQNRGLTQTGALREYREGGGSIRTSSWGSLWNSYAEGQDQWSKINYLTPGDTVPESYYYQTDINFQRKYVARYTVDVMDTQGNIIDTIHRQVESDRRLTVQMWQDAMIGNTIDDTSIDVNEVIAVYDVEFFERMGE